MRWWANPDVTSLRLRAHDHALLLAGGQVEYHVESDTGAVQVLDHRDPRSDEEPTLRAGAASAVPAAAHRGARRGPSVSAGPGDLLAELPLEGAP